MRSFAIAKNRVQPPIFVSTLIENTALTSHENRLAVPIFRSHFQRSVRSVLRINQTARLRDELADGLGSHIPALAVPHRDRAGLGFASADH